MSFKFAVIIATCNRCESLKDTLESLLNQECDWNAVSEILVVDNNSTDQTFKLVESFKSRMKTDLTYLKEARTGKSYAVNSAITAARADVLIFTDDDVILDRKWLHEIFNFFETTDVDAMGGRVLPLYPPQVPEWIKKNRYYLRGPIVSYDHGEEIIDFESGKVPAFIGANVVYKKNIFEEVGGFNVELGPGKGTFGDDVEMFERVAQAKKNIFYNGKALALHKIEPQRMTLGYIALWNFRNGKYKARREKETSNGLRGIKRVPFYLMRRVVYSAFILIFSIFWPSQFLKNWCAFTFDCGMIAGHREKR